MKYRNHFITALLMACLFLNACATVLTVSAPPVQETVLGEKAIGRRISTNYHLIQGTDECTLMQQPYCLETAEEIITTRKRVHGLSAALLEAPLYGLGLLDIMSATIYAKASVEKTKGNYVETGAIVECGIFKSAAGVELTVQCAETGEIVKVKTDSTGSIETKMLFAEFQNNSQINVFVKEDGGFAYITTLDNVTN